MIGLHNDIFSPSHLNPEMSELLRIYDKMYNSALSMCVKNYSKSQRSAENCKNY
jgi:hypothetical protein